MAQVPMNAVGVMSHLNNDPLVSRYVTNVLYLYHVVSVSENEIIMEPNVVAARALDFYLGGILSADRQNLYWVNNTSPLPSE